MSIKWNPRETKLLLKLYLKYKDDFQGHRKQNSKIWHEIVKEMSEMGINATYIKLDRKFRNMKRTYFNIKRQNRKPRPNWEYYKLMEEIFSDGSQGSQGSQSPEEEDFEIDKKFEAIEDDFPSLLMDESNFDVLISDRVKYEEDEQDVQDDQDEEDDVDIECPFGNLADELEAQRIEELRGIRRTLEEANTIQRERNHILQERNFLMQEYLAALGRKPKF